MSAASADRYLGGRLLIEQSPDGYRAGIDAALLASSIVLRPGDGALEFGCGAGAALLSAASLNPGAAFTGLERDPSAAALAAANIAANDLSDHVRVIGADALSWKDESGFDAVFFNPPFFDDPGALRAPKDARRAAWLNDATLEDWILTGLKRLKENGVLTIVHRADRLADLLAPLAGRAGDAAILPVHPRADLGAKRVVLAARKASKAPLRLLPPLVLHPAAGSGYTDEAAAILRGERRIALHAPRT